MKAIILLLCLCLSACSIFKHTKKAEASEVEKVEKIADSRSLVLKTALRETNTFTYNPDGSILQFQQIQEEVAQSEAVQVKKSEHSSLEKEVVTRESAPAGTWIWLGIGLVAVVGALFYIRFIIKIKRSEIGI